MGNCGACVFAPKWESESKEEKGLCRWAQQYSGLPVPQGIKPWIRHHEDFASFLTHLMHPVTRVGGLGCQAFIPKALEVPAQHGYIPAGLRDWSTLPSMRNAKDFASNDIIS